MKIPWEGWEIIDEIGNGSYGTVYEIEKGEETKAVKVIEIPREDEYSVLMKEHAEDAEDYCRSLAQDFETEVSTLNLLSGSPNIVHIEDYKVEKQENSIGWNIYILMECLTGFSEYSATHKMNEEKVIQFTMDIAHALMLCEEKGIIHRDIKPENILVKDDVFQLCDFGLARQIKFKENIKSVKGTYKYMAPEVYHGESYNHTVDIYSLGLIVYQYMNKRRGVFLPTDKPFIVFKEEEESLGKRMSNEPIPKPIEASEEFADIILKMIAYDPKERYQTAKILLKDLTLLQKGLYKKKRKISLKKHKKAIIASLIGASLIGVGFWMDSSKWEGRVCGDNAYATLTHDGVLTISGKGVVDDNIWYDDKNNIKKLIINKGITAIENGTSGLFYECPNLESVSLPEGLEEIGENTFAECKKLKTININKDLLYIGTDAFYHTAWISEKHGFVVVNGILLQYMEEYPKKLIIPEGVKYITTNAFEGNDEVEEIIFPKGIEAIESQTFENFTKLSKVEFQKGEIQFGADVFTGSPWGSREWVIANGSLLKYNGKEEKPDIPKEVLYIVPYSFSENPYIKEIIIPDYVVSISFESFCNCSSLEKVKIGKNIKEIPEGAFYNDTELEEVILPNDINIHPDAFKNCVKLKGL